MELELLKKVERNKSLIESKGIYTKAFGDRLVGEERKEASRLVTIGYLREYRGSGANGRKGYYYLTALGREYLDGFKEVA